mgnify:FL=1
MQTRPQRLFLIGPMGSGKTTVGRVLAKKLGLTFVDVDESIEARCGVEVDRIFEIEGEEGFRRRETQMLDELTLKDGQVVATGGGSVLSEKNRDLLRGRGTTVWLKTSVQQQLRRLARDKRRPLLQTPDRRARLEAMAKIRDPLYAECADIIVLSANITPQAMAHRAAKEILEALSSMQDTTAP